MPRESLLDMGARMNCSKWEAHTYLPIYDDLFSARRDEPLTLVEFGVADGTSLRMWAEYFPQARIIGVDEGLNWVEHANRLGPRISAHHHLQQDREVGRIMSTFLPDIVIDDAGHNHVHEMICFFHTFPHLRPGGFYCVEDIQNAAEIPPWQAWGAQVYANYTSSQHHDYRYDDVLAVIRKG